MKTLHPTLATFEEFCKYYEQESEIGKRRLFRMYEIALKEVETRRKRDKRRYQEKKLQEAEDRTISIQTEAAPEPVAPPAPEPAPAPAPEPVPEQSLPTIQEEPEPIVKQKRNSFTIPRPNMTDLMVRSTSPARAAYPQIISDTKKMREPKRPPPV